MTEQMHIGNHISYTITTWHDGQNGGDRNQTPGLSPIENELVIIDFWLLGILVKTAVWHNISCCHDINV